MVFAAWLTPGLARSNEPPRSHCTKPRCVSAAPASLNDADAVTVAPTGAGSNGTRTASRIGGLLSTVIATSSVLDPPLPSLTSSVSVGPQAEGDRRRRAGGEDGRAVSPLVAQRVAIRVRGAGTIE